MKLITQSALKELKDAGVTLLNQAVLLKGVNDDVDTLSKLNQELFDCGVLPYYLHLLDKVTGASHFDIPEPKAIALHQSLTKILPGYLVPKLVRDVPGKASKTVIY